MLTIGISLIALTVSILTAYLNSRQKKFETQRTLRNQLTEILGKISTLNLELAKIPQQGQSASGLTADMRGHIIDQKRLLVRQAN
jgi:transcriptional antiterminator